MLRLADTSIRMYRRKDARVSFKLRSYLMVRSDIGFSLSDFLRDISCRLTLVSGRVIEFERVWYGVGIVGEFALNTMVHRFGASAVADMDVIRDSVGTFRMDYLISFTGDPAEKPDYFEIVVPLVGRPTIYGRW